MRLVSNHVSHAFARKLGASGVTVAEWVVLLVTRKESTRDRRYRDIELTQAAIAAVPKLAKLADESDEEFFRVLSKAERKALTEILRKTAALHRLKKLPAE
jgi:MarR family transcriptional regulator, transcriptional regulator for hemolysin